MMFYSNFAQANNIDVPYISPCLTSANTSSSSLNALNETKIKLKLKKDALEHVDYLKEYQSDPKYKTELCKSFSETGFCAYGNKCRFAHGRQELFDKLVNCKKYKQKECLSFFKNQYCCYGSRCHFKHEERKLPQLERTYHTLALSLYNNLTEEAVLDMSDEQLKAHNNKKQRLEVFNNFDSEKNGYTTSNKSSSSSLMSNCSAHTAMSTPKLNPQKTKTALKYINQIENFDKNQKKFTLNYTNNLFTMF
jgi:hypothetical protein